MKKINKKGVMQLIPIAILIIIAFIGMMFIVNAKLKKMEGEQTKLPPVTPPPDNCQVNPGKCTQPLPCADGFTRDNSWNCIQIPCPDGFFRDSNGNCKQSTLPEVTVCTPSGFIKSAYVRTKGTPLDVVTHPFGSYPAWATFQFQATSDCEANYYYEVGIKETGALTILVPPGSKCDGNTHYAGKAIKMSKNTILESGKPAGFADMAFFPIDYNKQGKFTLVGGVYSGCFRDGGVQIAGIPETVINIGQYSDSEITNSWKKTV